MKSSIKILAAFSVFLIAQQTVGTPPETPPYHQYVVSGTISRTGGLPLGNFVVLLKGKFSSAWSLLPPDSLISVSIYRVPSDNENYPSVTDSAGRFSVIVATQPKADSLVIEITAADKPVFRGPAVGVTSQGITLTTHYTETQPGCSGCSNESMDRMRIIGYQHFLPDQAINLPF